jgi:hemerythrin-like domain-containing protein
MNPATSVTAQPQQHTIKSTTDLLKNMDMKPLSEKPLDLIKCFHNAFRKDIAQIDETVTGIARTNGNLTPILDRIHTLNEHLDYHANGEEAAVFPAMDKVAPQVATAYLMDHRQLDIMTNNFETIRKNPNPDPLTTARATAVSEWFLRVHLDKEDAHLYKILREHTTDDEQIAIVGIMARNVPPEKHPTMIGWLFPLLDLDDQVRVAKGWAKLMPPQAFASAKPLIQKATAANWTRLTKLVPELEQK